MILRIILFVLLVTGHHVTPAPSTAVSSLFSCSASPLFSPPLSFIGRNTQTWNCKFPGVIPPPLLYDKRRFHRPLFLLRRNVSRHLLLAGLTPQFFPPATGPAMSHLKEHAFSVESLFLPAGALKTHFFEDRHLDISPLFSFFLRIFHSFFTNLLRLLSYLFPSRILRTITSSLSSVAPPSPPVRSKLNRFSFWTCVMGKVLYTLPPPLLSKRSTSKFRASLLRSVATLLWLL